MSDAVTSAACGAPHDECTSARRFTDTAKWPIAERLLDAPAPQLTSNFGPGSADALRP